MSETDGMIGPRTMATIGRQTAKRQPTEAQINAAARVIYNTWSWYEVDPPSMAAIRAEAEAALIAALNVSEGEQ